MRFTDTTKTNTSQIYGNSIILDRKKPTGAIQINGGSYITNNPNVTVNISAIDELSGIDYYIEISADNTNWTNIGNVSTANITLTTENRVKKVYMKIHDKVTLTAVPDTSSVFTGWSGDCSSCGTNTTCNVIMDTNTITASVNPANTGTITCSPIQFSTAQQQPVQ